MTGRLEELLERIASGVEKLANDPEIEIDSGPALCPACGKLNPIVDMPSSEGGRGPLAEIAIEAQCTHCGHNLYAVVESYSMHQHREQAVAEIKERAASYNHE